MSEDQVSAQDQPLEHFPSLIAEVRKTRSARCLWTRCAHGAYIEAVEQAISLSTSKNGGVIGHTHKQMK